MVEAEDGGVSRDDEVAVLGGRGLVKGGRVLGTDDRESGRRGRGLEMGDTVLVSGGGGAEEVRELFWPSLLPVQPTISPEK